MSAADALLLHALLIFLMAGSVAGLFAGALLVLRPDWLLRAGKYANRWISTRRFSRPLDQVVKLDRWFYRYRRTSGVLILAGAVFLIYFFTAGFDRAGALAGLSGKFSIQPALMGGLLDALVLGSLAGAAFALIVSLFLLLRPSLLRGFEEGANRWFSLRHALKPLEIPRMGVDEYVFRHVQLAGVLLLAGSLYVLVVLAIWLG